MTIISEHKIFYVIRKKLKRKFLANLLLKRYTGNHIDKEIRDYDYPHFPHHSQQYSPHRHFL